MDADQAVETSVLLVIDHDRRDNVSVQEAITWATQARYPVTLYIYDADNDPTDVHFRFAESRFPIGDDVPGL